MTLKELYGQAVEDLDDAGIESPEVDAFYLLEDACGLSRSGYLLNKDRQVKADVAAAYLEMIKRRAAGEPYQYITGKANFLGYDIKVTPDVLIPRLDSEVTAEIALGFVKEGTRVLDMCTGSGCLAVAIKKERPGAEVSAADISEAALEIARSNATAHGANVTFTRSDLFGNVDGVFDVIVSNPPYVTEEEYGHLSREVREHEPMLALVAGKDGLDIYRRLIPKAREHLKGELVLEIGCRQAEAVGELLKENGYTDIRVHKDLAGLDRVVTAYID